jgi:hypothetical protein
VERPTGETKRPTKIPERLMVNMERPTRVAERSTVYTKRPTRVAERPTVDTGLVELEKPEKLMELIG